MTFDPDPVTRGPFDPMTGRADLSTGPSGPCRRGVPEENYAHDYRGTSRGTDPYSQVVSMCRRCGRAGETR